MDVPLPEETCPIKSIPAEMRNRIYDLVFAPDDPDAEGWYEDPETRLEEARPPSKAMLLACRQVYNKAKYMYRAAYRLYWTSTRFYVSLEGSSPDSAKCKQLSSDMRSVDTQTSHMFRTFHVLSRTICFAPRSKTVSTTTSMGGKSFWRCQRTRERKLGGVKTCVRSFKSR